MATQIGIGITAYNLYDAYKSDGNTIGKNTKITAAGSWPGGIGGSATGVAIGTACVDIGTNAGGIIGGIAEDYDGEKIGEKLLMIKF